jgi:hypothetical protein
LHLASSRRLYFGTGAVPAAAQRSSQAPRHPLLKEPLHQHSPTPLALNFTTHHALSRQEHSKEGIRIVS